MIEEGRNQVMAGREKMSGNDDKNRNLTKGERR